MGRRRRRQPPTREETAAAIEEVAERVEAGDLSFELQMPLTTAQEGLLELRDVDGSLLLNRVSLMQLTENGTRSTGYEYVSKTVGSMNPLDPAVDGEALRSLAARVRAAD